MNYQQTVNYLYNSTPVFEHVGASAYKEGLSNTLALDEHFGHPHRRYQTIHVAGTNGKGSTANFLSGLMKSIPPLNELFDQAGLSLPEYLAKKKEIETSPDPSQGGEEREA